MSSTFGNPFLYCTALCIGLLLLCIVGFGITVNISVFCLSIKHFGEYVKCSSYIGWLLPITSIFPFFSCTGSVGLEYFKNKSDPNRFTNLI